MNKKGAGFKKEPAPLDGDSWATGANKGCSLGYFPKNENRKNNNRNAGDRKTNNKKQNNRNNGNKNQNFKKGNNFFDGIVIK